MPRPVRILGAGPAGLTTALVLARAGRDVEVHERRGDCGTRFGGDLQGLENWSADEDAIDELAGWGVAPDFHHAPFREGFQTNGRRDDRLTFPRPAFYLVKRGVASDTLDQGLKRQALAAGVRLRFRSTLDPREVDVVATGPRGRAAFAVDKGIVFDTDAPDLAVAMLNDRAALKGYSYLLVTSGYGCLCTMLFDEFPSVHARFEEARRTLLARFGVRVSNPRPVGGVGHFAGRPRWRAAEGDALHVGEAAGLQDFLWGFGIRAAMRSGVLAARALLGAGDYEAEAARRLEPGVRASVVNRFVWELARHGDYRVTMAALRWGGPFALIRWMHRFGAVQRLLYPAARAYGRRAYPHLAF